MRSTIFLAVASLLLATVPAAARAETDSGSASFYPWSGYWWPHAHGGMSKPLSKYDQLTGARAAAWEAANHDLSSSAPSWHGYCHAWSAAAVTEKEPKESRTLAGSANRQVSFGIGDQKALLSACHTDDIAHTWGQRFSGPGSDKNDIKPDELWALLQSHVKQQKIPLVLDLEAGEEVWNYPIYQYRIDYHDAGNGWYNGTMQLVAADDDVQPDYVGTDASLYTYTFRVRFQNGAMVMGSGEWTGESVDDHPDFAWYPYVAVAGNPEVQLTQVAKIVGYEVGGNTAPNDEGDTTPVGVGEPGEETGEPVAVDPENLDSLLSPDELVNLVLNKTSHFDLDIFVQTAEGAGADGLKFRPGDKIRIGARSAEKGYLYLFDVTPNGDLKLVFPRAGEPNLIEAGKTYDIPGAGTEPWFTAEGTGQHDLKGIVTQRPIRLTGFTLAMQQETQQQGGGSRTSTGNGGTQGTAQGTEQTTRQHVPRSMYVHPTAQKRLRGRLFAFFRKGDPGQEEKPPAKLGRFAQDQSSYFVLAEGTDARQGGQDKPRQGEQPVQRPPARGQNPLPKPNR